MNELAILKTFNCRSCGPVEKVKVFGDWVNDSYKGIDFIITRSDYEEFSAKISEESPMKPDYITAIHACVAAEQFVSEHRRVFCMKCNCQFLIQKPQEPNDGVISQGPQAIPTPAPSLAALMQGSSVVGNTNPNIKAILNQLAEADLDRIINELQGNGASSNFPDKDSKLEYLTDLLL
jgi:hypothetical protein